MWDRGRWDDFSAGLTEWHKKASFLAVKFIQGCKNACLINKQVHNNLILQQKGFT